jgi:GDPmannose 4,6-dehydratase
VTLLTSQSKRVLIVGHSGQDGTLLSESIKSRGDQVFGFSRSGFYPPNTNLCNQTWNASDKKQVRALLIELRPDEIYYLAAHHTSSEGTKSKSAIEDFDLSYETHVLGLLQILVVVEESIPSCRIFYAASSLVYEGDPGEIQDEQTPFCPSSFYGMTKAQGVWLCREFRNNRGVFASTGILYNHESRFRAPHFLSQKIIRAAARIALGSREKLKLGDITARVDWGYAGDFVNAFQKILKLPFGDDFIVATGESHTVREFAELSFACFGLDWREHTEHSPEVLTRRLSPRVGDASKLRAATGWVPTMSFAELINHLVDSERDRLVHLAQL